MVAGSLAVLSLVFVAGEAAASAVASRNSALSNLLRARQGSIIDPGDIPSQCQSTCATMVSAFNACSEDQSQCLQICQNLVMSSVASCLTCSIAAQGGSAALLAQGQESLKELEDSCAAAGDAVSSFTLSGATAAPTSASGAGSSASLSLPAASGTSQSIFFSSGSAAGAPSSSGSAATSASAPLSTLASSSAAGAGTITKQTVTALSTAAASSPAPGSSSTDSATDLNPSATAGASSGAARTAGVSLLGLLGAAVAFAAQL